MSLIHHYDAGKDILYCTAEGQVSIEDFIQLMLEITTSEKFSPDVRTLWDVRKLDFASITNELADQLISLRQNNPQRGKTRIVIVANKDHGFGMSRMYEMLSIGLPQEMRVFRDYAEAEKWLLRVEQV